MAEMETQGGAAVSTETVNAPVSLLDEAIAVTKQTAVVVGDTKSGRIEAKGEIGIARVHGAFVLAVELDVRNDVQDRSPGPVALGG